MKNLFATFAIMILFGVSLFAQNSANTTASCSAQVIRALSISKNQDLDFGKVAQGVTASIPVTNSKAVKFTVLGEDNENITVSYSAPSNLIHTDGSTTLPFTSYVKSNSSDNASSSSDLSSGSTVALNGTGNYFVYLGGQVSPGTSQLRGLYSANFTINVEY